MDAAFWITHLKLQPHPEGGFYKETFRSESTVTRPESQERHSASTSIYYLLEGDDFSGFHRIVSDELWYFHKGEPLLIHVIDGVGALTTLELSDRETGELSRAVKGGCWFASELKSKNGFSLVSCNVAPGFEFSEFEMAMQENMLRYFPAHASAIKRLCRK
jgi:predicted cupin superfamily sugar epimerase